MPYEADVHLWTAPSGGSLVTRLPSGTGWRRSIRRNGGFWQASATLDERKVELDLYDAFQTWLGLHVQERSAGLTTWEGRLWELVLTVNGEQRKRSLEDVKNAVKTTYQNNGEVAETAFSTQAQSVARYGRREEALLLDNYPQATAEAHRASYLAEHAWPWPRPVAFSRAADTTLQVRCCGWIYTANWMFVKEGDGTADDVDDWMAEILGSATGLSSNHGGSVSGAGDCQYLKAGSLSTNTLQVTKTCASPQRAWDLLQEMAALGDASGNPWSVWADVGQVVHYKQASLTPRYYLREGQLYDTPGGENAVNPFTVRPAVVRNMDYPLRLSEPGSMLDDARDTLVEEVEVNELGEWTLRPAVPMEEDALAAQYQRQEGQGA